MVRVATRCLHIAEPGSVIISNFVALLNLTDQASVISISRGEYGE
jgi:hypothetical protein